TYGPYECPHGPLTAEVRNARVVQGIGGGCDQEALRVIRGARFEPGRLNGEIVNTSMTTTISFTLR
ncbi:MAG: energy transducer TonB, partial [Bacteroidota bacterium]|nr:energy transducer TonB [Bacteroidota bacterium]